MWGIGSESPIELVSNAAVSFAGGTCHRKPLLPAMRLWCVPRCITLRVCHARTRWLARVRSAGRQGGQVTDRIEEARRPFPPVRPLRFLPIVDGGLPRCGSACRVTLRPNSPRNQCCLLRTCIPHCESRGGREGGEAHVSLLMKIMERGDIRLPGRLPPALREAGWCLPVVAGACRCFLKEPSSANQQTASKIRETP